MSSPPKSLSRAKSKGPMRRTNPGLRGKSYRDNAWSRDAKTDGENNVYDISSSFGGEAQATPREYINKGSAVVEENRPVSYPSTPNKGSNIVRYNKPTQTSIQGEKRSSLEDWTIIGDKPRKDSRNGNSEFRVHKKNRFKPGLIIKILWSEPRGDSRGGCDNSERSSNHSGQTNATLGTLSFEKVRRFVVIRVFSGHCICLSLSTYGGQGTQKLGVHPRDHAAVYSSGKELLAVGEQLMRKPLRIDTLQGEIDPMTRINYAKLYTVEYNVKIAIVGRIDRDSEHQLVYDYNDVHPALEPFSTPRYQFAPPSLNAKPEEPDFRLAKVKEHFDVMTLGPINQSYSEFGREPTQSTTSLNAKPEEPDFRLAKVKEHFDVMTLGPIYQSYSEFGREPTQSTTSKPVYPSMPPATEVGTDIHNIKYSHPTMSSEGFYNSNPASPPVTQFPHHPPLATSNTITTSTGYGPGQYSSAKPPVNSSQNPASTRGGSDRYSSDDVYYWAPPPLSSSLENPGTGYGPGQYSSGGVYSSANPPVSSSQNPATPRGGSDRYSSDDAYYSAYPPVSSSLENTGTGYGSGRYSYDDAYSSESPTAIRDYPSYHAHRHGPPF